MTIPPVGPTAAACANEQVDCPFAQVREINLRIVDNTLSPADAARRIAALHAGRRLVESTADLARRVGMGRSRVSTLLNRRPAVSASAGKPVTENHRGETESC